MYPVVGFLAVGAAGAAMLHSWDLPRTVSFGFLALGLIAAGLAASSLIVPQIGPNPSMMAAPAKKEMPPTESRDASKVCAADPLRSLSAV